MCHQPGAAAGKVKLGISLTVFGLQRRFLASGSNCMSDASDTRRKHVEVECPRIQRGNGFFHAGGWQEPFLPMMVIDEVGVKSFFKCTRAGNAYDHLKIEWRPSSQLVPPIPRKRGTTDLDRPIHTYRLDEIDKLTPHAASSFRASAGLNGRCGASFCSVWSVGFQPSLSQPYSVFRCRPAFLARLEGVSPCFSA